MKHKQNQKEESRERKKSTKSKKYTMEWKERKTAQRKNESKAEDAEEERMLYLPPKLSHPPQVFLLLDLDDVAFVEGQVVVLPCLPLVQCLRI